jgi:hypothetical protein
MSSRRRLASALSGLLIAVASLLVLVPATVAKGDVVARLDAAIPRDAKPGTNVAIGWTLSVLEGTEWQAFDATGTAIFIRFVGTTAGSTTEALATGDGTGHFTAHVVIPRGGVSNVEIGIHGDCSGTACDDLFQLAGVGKAPAVVPADELDARIDPLPALGPPYTAVDVTVRVSLRPGVALDGRVLPGSVVVRSRDVDSDLATYAVAVPAGEGVYQATLPLPSTGHLWIEAGMGSQQGLSRVFGHSFTVLRLPVPGATTGAAAGTTGRGAAASAGGAPAAVSASGAAPAAAAATDRTNLPLALGVVAALAVLVLGLVLARRSVHGTARA